MENSDEKGVCVRPYVRMHAEDHVKSGSSDPDYTSSSEQSCDTVIYVGHLNHKEIDFTDNEGPPTSLPIVPKPKQQSQPQIKNESSSLERKRHNSFSKNSNEDQRKSDDKTTSHHVSDSSGHHQNVSKSGKAEKLQQSSKGSPLLQRHQPASTQTLGDVGHGSKSAQNSPIHAQKKTKHRTSQPKQDQGTDAELSGLKGTLGKTVKPPSDETWIDGPRFMKPKFDSKTLHQLQKEQWVDGPPNVYGFMDHHKQDMIQRWIEEHSRQVHSPSKKKNNEIWVDYPPGSSDVSGSCADVSKNSESGHGNSPKPAKSSSKDKRSGSVSSNKNESLKNSHSVDSYQFQNEADDVDDNADSASNSADVDETDNEENAEASGYDSDLHILPIGQKTIQGIQSSDSQYQENYDDYVETIEVMEPDEPVPMVDSCMQVTEEDILTEYWAQNKSRSSENPLPEVDQSGYDSKNHPLRILSEEDLNLASSFTDSRSVSVDLDSISVPDTCRDGIRGRSAVTWHLLYGNMFQRIKEQQQRERRTKEDLTSTNSEINEKLERIAKLRELIQPLTRIRNQTPVESIFKTCSVNRLPSAGSRYTMSEMLCNSRDSSMEDLSQADITSTQSEPADLDLDKYDYRANIKPMNGLKLEAFYKKIQKVPPFLEQYSSVKPTQIVPPLSFDQEKSFLISRMETQRSQNIAETSNYKHSPSTSNRNSLESGGMDDTSSSSPRHTNSLSRIHKNVSSSSLQKESNHNLSESTFLNKNQRPSGEPKQELKTKPLDRRDSKKSDQNDVSKRNDSKSTSRNVSNKNIDITQLTVGQSPSISSKSRLYRNKSKVSDLQNIHSQQPLSQSSTSSVWSKESSISSSPSKMAHRSAAYANGQLRGSGNKFHANNTNVPNNKNSRALNNAGCKIPARSSPTSSSTSGVTTTCCATMKQKDKQSAPKSKQSSSHSKQKQIQDSRKSQRTKSICRSTSSPSTCVDSGDTVFTDFTDSEQYHVARHASISGTITSPYHKIPQVHVSHHHHHHHQRTSSGHGSESSVNSIEPREAKELLLKGTKTQQFSGTSSGYESMLRDSEGTPLSSSQESGNEDTMDRGERGRKGRRKSQGNLFKKLFLNS